MGMGVFGKGTVGFIQEGFSGSIKFFVPTEKGRFGNVVSSGNEGNPDTCAVKFYSMVFRIKFMWQISL